MEPFPDPVGLKTSGSGFGSPTLLFGKCSLFVYTRKAGLFAALLGDLTTLLSPPSPGDPPFKGTVA